MKLAKPDVAIAFMPPAISALSFCRTEASIYKIASLHNDPVRDFEDSKRWDPSSLDQFRRISALNTMDLVVVLLPQYKEYFFQKTKSPVISIPNPVSIPRERQDIANRPKVVLAAGRLEKVKRYDLLLFAWGIVCKSYPDWKLIICGDGAEREGLLQIIKKLRLTNVKLMRFSEDIASKFQNARIFAHPSQHEGMPLAVLEALAHGVPVVGFSNCSGLNYLIHDNINGLLVSPVADKVSNFAEAIISLIDDEEKNHRLSRQACESILEYDQDKILKIWVGIVNSGLLHNGSVGLGSGFITSK